MDLIDDEGHLFGVVNVIDALVVLMVIAVLAAGIALVNPFAVPPEPAQRYATVDLGSHPDYVASQISAGDQLAEDAEGNLTVSDVYYTPGSNDQVQVYARVRLRGSLTDEPRQFQYAGQPLQQGNELSIQTPDYGVSGTITRLDRNGSSLQTSETQLQLTTTVSADIAETIQQDDPITVADRQVATIDAVEIAPTGNPSQRHVTLGATVQTYTGNGQPQYATTSVTPGASIPLQTADYALSGSVTDVGTSAIDTTQTNVVVETSIPTEAADEFDVGDTYTIANTDVATIETLQLYPGNENQRYAVLGLSLRTRTPNGERYFGPTRLSIGATVPFRTPSYGLMATVSRLDTTSLNTTTTAVVLETTVATTTAESIAAGDTYRVQGSTVATIDSVLLYPTGDPGTKHVLVGASLQTITTHATPEFAGTPVKLGTAIPISTATYDLTGRVVRVGSQTPPGQVTETTVRIQLANVPPEIADGIREGMTETRDGTTLATITNKRSVNATVVLTSDDGNIYRREHPVNQDVTLTVTLRTRTTDTGLTFHARSLQENTQVVLDLGTITVRGTVIEIQ